MKKAQSTYFVILGVLAVVLMGILVFNFNKDQQDVMDMNKFEQSAFDAQTKSFQKYFEECSKVSITKAGQEYGLSEEVILDYIDYANLELIDCMNSMFLELEGQGFKVSKESPMIDVEFNPESITVSVDYPSEISLDTAKFKIDKVIMILGRIESVHLPNGVATDEIVLNSPDRRAKMVIPAGTKVTDESGNPIESISLRTEDAHFDGLSNGVVIGNIVYEGGPDGAQFNPPIDIYMRIRSSDLPAFVSERSVSIGYWDDDMWVGMPTEVEEPGLLKAKLSHFSIYATVMCGGNGNEPVVVKSPTLYRQEYSLQTFEEDVQGNKLYNVGVTEEFCDKGSEKYWVEDKDTIVPTPEEYLKILKEEDERIIRSPEDLMRNQGGTATFDGIPFPPEYGTRGDTETCANKPQEVEQYCCCFFDESGQNKCVATPVSKNAIWGQQSCMRYLYDNGIKDLASMNLVKHYEKYPLYGKSLGDYPMYDFVDSEVTNGNDCMDLPIETGFESSVEGYNEEVCIDGYIGHSGVGGETIFDIKFKGNGNACIFKVQDDGKFYDIKYKQEHGTSCVGPDELIKVSSTGTKLGNEKIVTDTIVYGLEEITQVETDSYCADCGVEITVYGTGLEYDGNINYPCEDLAEAPRDHSINSKIIYEDGSPSCFFCEDVDGELTYVKQDVKVCDPYRGCGSCLALKIGEPCPPSEEGNNWCSNDYGCRDGFIISAEDIEKQKPGDWSDRCPPCLDNIDSRDSCTEWSSNNPGKGEVYTGDD